MKNLKKLLIHFLKVPAPIIFVSGRMGTGKTDFALLLTQLALAIHSIDKIGSNIKVDHPAFTRIESASKLEQWVRSDRSSKLFILDEAGVHIDSRNPLGAINKKIRHLAFLLRKHRAKMIVISQRNIDVESTIRDLTIANFQKQSKKVCIVRSQLLDDNIALIDIPRTSLPFSTYDIAEFSLESNEIGEIENRMCCRVIDTLRHNHFKIRKSAEILGIHHEEVRRYIFEHIDHLEKRLKIGTSAHKGGEDIRYVS